VPLLLTKSGTFTFLEWVFKMKMLFKLLVINTLSLSPDFLIFQTKTASFFKNGKSQALTFRKM